MVSDTADERRLVARFTPTRCLSGDKVAVDPQFVFHRPPSRGSLRMRGLGGRVMIVEQLERPTDARTK